MASFRDPARTFSPVEVIERLLEITDYYGHDPVLYISSSNDLATYLDSFGFDIYSLTSDTNEAFEAYIAHSLSLTKRQPLARERNRALRKSKSKAKDIGLRLRIFTSHL